MAGVYEHGATITVASELEYASVTVVAPDGTESDGEDLLLDQHGIWTFRATDGEDVETGTFYVRRPVVEDGS